MFKSWRIRNFISDRIKSLCVPALTDEDDEHRGLYQWQQRFLLETKQHIKQHASLQRKSLFAQVWTGSGKSLAIALLSLTPWLNPAGAAANGCILIITPSVLALENMKNYLGTTTSAKKQQMYSLLGLSATEAAQLESACVFGDSIASGSLADVLCNGGGLNWIIVLTHQKLIAEFQHTNKRMMSNIELIRSKVMSVIVDEGDYGTTTSSASAS